MPNMAKSIYSELYHSVSVMQLALQKNMRLSVEQGRAESSISLTIIY